MLDFKGIIKNLRIEKPKFLFRGLLAFFFVFSSLGIAFLLSILDTSHLIPWLPHVFDDDSKMVPIDYLSDIATFFGAIISFTVPLSIDSIMRASAQFSGSRVIKNRLANEFQMRYILPYFLSITFIAILGKWMLPVEAFSQAINIHLSRAFFVVLILHLSLGTILFAVYINRLYVYSIHVRKLKSEIENEIEKIIARQKNKPSRKDRDHFTGLIEGYGDIFLVEADASNTDFVREDFLPRIEKILTNIIDLGEQEKGERFLFEAKLLEIYDKAQLVQSESSARDIDEGGKIDTAEEKDFLEDDQTNDWDREWRFRLFFDPEKGLVTFSKTLQQLDRFYKRVLDLNREDDLGTWIFHSLVRVLRYTSKKNGQDTFLRILFDRIYSIAKTSFSRDTQLAYSSAIEWYTAIIFGLDETYKLNLAYVKEYNNTLFAILKKIVDSSDHKRFKYVIDTLLNSIDRGHYKDPYEIYNDWIYPNLPDRDASDEVNKRISKITKEGSEISSKNLDELQKWVEDTKKYLLSFEDKLGAINYESYRTEVNDYFSGIESDFKYKQLLKLIFKLSIYIIYQRQYKLLFLLLDAQQPLDSDVSWGGKEIYPSALDRVVRNIFTREERDSDLLFVTHRHGSGRFVTLYQTILLLNALTRHGTKTVELPADLKSWQLNQAKSVIDPIRSCIEELDAEGIYTELHFSPTAKPDLMTLLDSLQRSADQKLEVRERENSIDQNKVDEFRRDIVKGYSEHVVIRNIFEFKEKLDDRADIPYAGTVKQFGISEIREKAYFFEEWYVSYGDLGDQYGSSLAKSEDSELYEALASACILLDKPKLDWSEIFDGQEKIMIANRWFVFDLVDQIVGSDCEFIPEWQKDTRPILTELKNLNGFSGVLLKNGQEIAVFEVTSRNSSKYKEVLILNASEMGAIQSLSPMSQNLKESHRIEHIAVDVVDLANDETQKKKIITAQNDWLTKIGDESKQLEYLNIFAIIKIYERYKLILPKESIGIRSRTPYKSKY